MPTARFFNPEGPNRAGDHYTLPPLERRDLDDVPTLIDRKRARGRPQPRRAADPGGAGLKR